MFRDTNLRFSTLFFWLPATFPRSFLEELDVGADLSCFDFMLEGVPEACTDAPSMFDMASDRFEHPLVEGSSGDRDLFRDMFDGLPDEKKSKVGQNFYCLKDMFAESALSAGAACSGTDVVFPMITRLSEILTDWSKQSRSTFSPDIPEELFSIKHAFSCEIVPWKQDFISQNFQPVHLFRDIMVLGDGYGTTVNGEFVAVPRVAVFYVGFSCKDVSILNVNSPAHQDCVRKGRGKTGSTCQGALGYINWARPALVCMENVVGLAMPPNKLSPKFNGLLDPFDRNIKDNLKALVESLEEMDYIVDVAIINPTVYGVPQQRQRVWIIAIWKGQTCSNTSSFGEMMVPMRPLRDFLLKPGTKLHDEWSARKLQWPQQCPKKATRKPEADQPSKVQRTMQWTRRHKATYEKNMMEWPPTIPQDWLPAVPDRIREVIWFQQQMIFQKDPNSLSQTIVFDVSQSIDREHKAEDKAPCVCPKAILVMMELEGMGEPSISRISGIEALMLQCMPPSSIPSAKNLDERQLMDLAGNAFCGVAAYVAAVYALSMNTFPTVAMRRRFQVARPSKEVAEAHAKFAAEFRNDPDMDMDIMDSDLDDGGSSSESDGDMTSGAVQEQEQKQEQHVEQYEPYEQCATETQEATFEDELLQTLNS